MTDAIVPSPADFDNDKELANYLNDCGAITTVAENAEDNNSRQLPCKHSQE